MQLTETIKLYLSKEQERTIRQTMQEYIKTVNGLVQLAVGNTHISEETKEIIVEGKACLDMKCFSTATLKSWFPDNRLESASQNQAINEARSIVKKYKKQVWVYNKRLQKTKPEYLSRLKQPTLPILKKPVCTYINTALKIKDNYLSLPFFEDKPGKKKTKRLLLKTCMTEQQKEKLANSKLGTARLTLKSNMIVAQIVYGVEEKEYKPNGIYMGVDLGIKCPAVSYTSTGKVKFYGNGRQNKYIRRHYQILRRMLGKKKRLEVIKRINQKEQRVMLDIDHKISRQIVNTAIANDVTQINLENLKNIRSTVNAYKKNYRKRYCKTRKSLKNSCDVNNWSFFRLAQFIEYKAKLAGIKVETVNPAYTSQTCPKCGKRNHANDRNYKCECGFHIHRDLLGAINICFSTEYVGGTKDDARHTCAED